VLGHTLTTTEITLGRMLSDGRWRSAKTQRTSPSEPGDRGLLVDGSAT
jgi:hypothetical protein